MAEKEIVLIGVGEIGGVFARGFLRLGYSVHPITRKTDMNEIAVRIKHPQLVVVAVGENDLQAVLNGIPETWKSKLCLLQNELLPNDWRGVPDPTVISIWFEKKPGMDAKVIIPSPVYGPQAHLVAQALDAVSISSRVLTSKSELLNELVVKNLYILTTNIAGLRTGGTVGELWRDHRTFAIEVAEEVVRLQEMLTGISLDTSVLIQSMTKAFDGDPDHKCMGRSAPARLARALEHAQSRSLELPLLIQVESEIHV
ncbi:MAG: hypothetical protein KZQ77_19455 [Candidatus Thiodiazotropha sp. (ex Notomyrtea botanica)]|nr:hypothetical protein [Candidatus Thiodiazotropha sp. (ex Notomyrtea botanica)]